MFRLTESSETAEDVLQEVFIKLWLQREELREVVNVNAWIYRLAHNHALNGLKRLAKEASVRALWSAEQAAVAPGSDAQVMLNDTQKLLVQAIEQLPPQQKLIYRLSRQQGLKYEEIGVQLGISPLTVKKHMAQALQSLRKQLGRHHPDLAVVLGVVYQLLR